MRTTKGAVGGGRKEGQEPEGSNKNNKGCSGGRKEGRTEGEDRSLRRSNKNNKGCSGRREEGREDRSLRGAIRTTKGAVGGGRKGGQRGKTGA